MPRGGNSTLTEKEQVLSNEFCSSREQSRRELIKKSSKRLPIDPCSSILYCNTQKGCSCVWYVLVRQIWRTKYFWSSGSWMMIQDHLKSVTKTPGSSKKYLSFFPNPKPINKYYFKVWIRLCYSWSSPLLPASPCNDLAQTCSALYLIPFPFLPLPFQKWDNVTFISLNFPVPAFPLIRHAGLFCLQRWWTIEGDSAELKCPS